MKIKFLASAAAISAMFCANALACTTILVGEGASDDGSMLIARSADSKAIKAQVFLIHPKKKPIKKASTAQRRMTGQMISPIRCQKRA